MQIKILELCHYCLLHESNPKSFPFENKKYFDLLCVAYTSIVNFLFNLLPFRYIIREGMPTRFCTSDSNTGTKTKRVAFNVAIHKFLFKEVGVVSFLSISVVFFVSVITLYFLDL